MKDCLDCGVCNNCVDRFLAAEYARDYADACRWRAVSRLFVLREDGSLAVTTASAKHVVWDSDTGETFLVIADGLEAQSVDDAVDEMTEVADEDRQ
jgi:hypothetical protein